MIAPTEPFVPDIIARKHAFRPSVRLRTPANQAAVPTTLFETSLTSSAGVWIEFSCSDDVSHRFSRMLRERVFQP